MIIKHLNISSRQFNFEMQFSDRCGTMIRDRKLYKQPTTTNDASRFSFVGISSKTWKWIPIVESKVSEDDPIVYPLTTTRRQVQIMARIN